MFTGPFDVVRETARLLKAPRPNRDRLAKELMHHFGHDGNGTSAAEVSRALVLGEPVNWRAVGWACQEQMVQYFYFAPLPPPDYLHGIACFGLFAEAVRRGHFEWSIEFDSVLMMLLNNRGLHHAGHRAAILEFLARPPQRAVSN